MNEEVNEVASSFEDYIKKIPPPDENPKWREYISKMWVVSFAFGSEFTLKVIQDEFERATKEENK